MVPVVKNILNRVPVKTQMNWAIRGISLLKIPLLAFAWPEVLEVTEEKSRLRIPFTYRTKNHVNSMYFGALCMGGEAVVGLHVLDEIRKNGKLDFVFKDFKAQFLKRAQSDVIFICDEGRAIRDLVKQARDSKERQNLSFSSYALTPDKTGDEKIAEFSLTLSIKQR